MPWRLVFMMDETKQLLARVLPETTLISIGHRASLEAYHRRLIAIDRSIGRPGRVLERAGDVVPAESAVRAAGTTLKISGS